MKQIFEFLLFISPTSSERYYWKYKKKPSNKPVDTSIRSPRTLSLGRAGGTLRGRGHSIRTVLPSCTDNDRRRPSSYPDISAVTEKKKIISVKLIFFCAEYWIFMLWMYVLSICTVSQERRRTALLEWSCLCWITGFVYCCSEWFYSCLIQFQIRVNPLV